MRSTFHSYTFIVLIMALLIWYSCYFVGIIVFLIFIFVFFVLIFDTFSSNSPKVTVSSVLLVLFVR